MTQTSLAALYRTPHWITDLVVGTVVALFVLAAAHSAVASRPDRTEAEARGLRGALPASVPARPAAPPPALAFADPVRGYDIVSPFGLRRLPWEEYARLHAGVDIAAPAGLPVRAIADGVVRRAGRDGAYGRFVEVRHAGGITSFYAHLGAVDAAARPGAAVRGGTTIGRIGSTGASTGAHLHLEVRNARGRPLNPGLLLGRQYAALDDLPLRAAARVPRRVRIAYVSYIPKAKRELMEEREREEMEARAQAVAAKAEEMAALEAGAGQPGAVPPAPILPGKPQVIELPAPATGAEAVPGKARSAPSPSPAPSPTPPPVRVRPPAVLDPDTPMVTATAA